MGSDKDNKWACINQKNDNKLLQKMKYLPNDSKQTSNSICWNTWEIKEEKKEQTKAGDDKKEDDGKVQFKVSMESYSEVDFGTLKGTKLTAAGSDQGYIAIELKHKSKEKKVIIVTTHLESEKSAYGEIIRISQMKDLMKAVKELKDTNDTPVILSADLSVDPKDKGENTNVEPKADSLAKLNIDEMNGEWTCQINRKNVELVIENLKYKVKGEDDKEVDYKITQNHNLCEIKDSEDKVYWTMSNYNNQFILKSPENEQQELSCKKKGVTEDVAHQFYAEADMVKELEGKTFYDFYNQKYVVAKKDDKKIEVSYGENKKVSIDLEKDKNELKMGDWYVLQRTGGEYVWTNSVKTIVWSQAPYNPLKYVNYVPSTYSFVTAGKIATTEDMKAKAKTQLETLETKQGSLVDKAAEKFVEDMNTLIKALPTLTDLKNEDMQLKSSQKELLTEEPKTSVTMNGEKQEESTVDYIMNIGNVTPIGHLKIPDITNPSLPNAQYPSNHVSIMTYYQFAEQAAPTQNPPSN